MTLYHTAAAKCQSLCFVKEKMSARLSSEHCNVDALCFKVTSTPVSPEKFKPVKHFVFFVLYFVKCNNSELV